MCQAIQVVLTLAAEGSGTIMTGLVSPQQQKDSQRWVPGRWYWMSGMAIVELGILIDTQYLRIRQANANE